jgi:hypothetical protein
MAESNPPQDPFEMFRRLWGPLGLPVPGMAVPTMDPKEVEKRIAELRSVESWLQVNLNMVRFAVQGLEMQRSALLAMGAGAPAAAPQGPGSAAGGMMWPWAVMQQAMAGKPAPGEAAPGAEDKKKPNE